MITLRLSISLLAMLLIVRFSSTQTAIDINPENLKHMKDMAGSMNGNAEPCEDFHQYACGKGVPFLDNVGYSQVKYLLDIVNILQTHYPIAHKENQSFAEKLHIYFKACEGVKNASLLPFLKEVKPAPAREWPFLEEMQVYSRRGNNQTHQAWSTNGTEVIQLLGQLFSYGLNNVFFSIRNIEFENKSISLLGVPSPSDVDTESLVTLLLSFKLPRSLVEKYFYEFVETHQQLQSKFYTYPKNFGDTIRTYAQLKQNSGILSHLSKFVETIYPHPIKIEEQSFFFFLSYVKTVLTTQWEPQEARKLHNYIMFQFLLHLKETMEPGYYLTSSDTKFVLALNFVYHKHLIMPHKEEYDQGFALTVKKLYKQFADTVAENRLNLSEKQTEEMLTKLGNLHTNIGNIPANITQSMVEDYYSTLPDLDVDNFYKTELAVRRHAHLETIICPKDMFCHESPPHAFYHPLSNTITFPYTALTPPMYDWSWHPVFAMSILGFAAGHELVHAIDSSVLDMPMYTPSFDGDSLQVPTIKAAVSCLKQQYPTETVDERLADVVGAQLAFATYKRYYGLQPEFTRTPWQQLYFMSLAQPFCGIGNDQDVEHDAVKVRLDEIVINSQDFAEAFQCSVGSKMNPVKKCSYI